MKNAIVITNVDSLLGYALAYRFLEDWNRSVSGLRGTTEFRLLCHEAQGLEDLERLGGKIYPVQNFADEVVMRHIMQNVFYVMYVPEHSSQRVQEGEAVLKGAKDQNVEYVTMFSYSGLDQLKSIDIGDDKLKNLKEFLHLEKKLASHFDHNCYCIMRSAIWNQFFYYFGPMIEDDNKIKLPVRKDSKWGTIDLTDLVDAAYNLSRVSEEDDVTLFESRGQLYVSNLKKKNKTLFEFTPRHNITAEKLVEYARDGLKREDMTYKECDPSELRDYLSRIHNDNRFRARPIHHGKQIKRQEDRPYTFPLGKYLNDTLINTLVEYWQVVDSTEAIKPTEDLEKTLDRKPLDIHQFFKENRDQFRRLR